MLFSGAFLNTAKYFLHNKSHKETECVAHKKTPLENKGGGKKLTKTFSKWDANGLVNRYISRMFMA